METDGGDMLLSMLGRGAHAPPERREQGTKHMDNFMSNLRQASRFGNSDHLSGARTFEEGQGKRRDKQKAWQNRLVQKKWGSTDAKRHVLNHVTLREHGPHETIVLQGDDADAMFFAVSGELDVVVGKNKVHVLRAGDFFGEYALLHKGKCTATIISRTAVSLRVLSKTDFEAILHDHPTFEAELRPQRNYVMDMKKKKIERIRRTILYRPRSGSVTDLIMKLALKASQPLLKQQRFVAGDEVCRQGEVATEMYFVLAGQLDVEVSGQKVHTVKEGEFFGEYALLNDSTRSGTVKVADDQEDCVLWRISKAALNSIMMRNPQVKEMLQPKRDYVSEKHVAFQQRQQKQLEEMDIDEQDAGDMEMYTIENLMKRAALQDHPLVIAAIRRFWCLMDPTKDDKGQHPGTKKGGADSAGSIVWKEYQAVNVRMQRALVVDVTREEAEEIAGRDWRRDVQDHNPEAKAILAKIPADASDEERDAVLFAMRMTFVQFSDSLFELADIWCEDIDGGQYASFIDDLLGAVTLDDRGGRRASIREEGDVECVEGWMRRKFSVAMMNEIEREEEEEAAEAIQEMQQEQDEPMAPAPVRRDAEAHKQRRMSVREMIAPEMGKRQSAVPAAPVQQQQQRRRRTSAVGLYEAMTLVDKRAFLEELAPRDRVLFWDSLEENEQLAIVQALPKQARKELVASVAPKPGEDYGKLIERVPLNFGSEEEEEEEEEAEDEYRMVKTGEYYATTGGGNRVLVTMNSPVRVPRPASESLPPSPGAGGLSQLRVSSRRRRRKVASNPVAAHYSAKPLENYLEQCMRERPFDEAVAASALVTTPSRWRRGPGGNKGGFRGSRRQEHVGAPGFGMMSPGAVGAYVSMEPGKALLLPKIVKRTHFKPSSNGSAGHLERRQMSVAVPETQRAGGTGFTAHNLGVSKNALYRTAQYLGSGRSTEEQFLGGSLHMAPLGGI